MAARWSQRRGRRCRWPFFLLLGLLKLFGIAETLILAEMSTDISSLRVGESKVISKMGDNVTFYCRANFQLSSLEVSWYRLSQHGLHTLIHSYSAETDVWDQSEEFEDCTFLISQGEVVLTLKYVRPQDSGTYKCILKDNTHSVERYAILLVTAREETLQEDEDTLVIYSMVGLISVGLIVWVISLSILCRRGDLQCPRNWGQEI